MPTYQYECEDCGPFSEMRPISEFDQPQPCPDCGRDAPRLLTLPAIGGNAIENQAATAPMRAHPGGCSCCVPRRLSAEAV